MPQAYTPKIQGLPHIVAVSAWNFFGSRYRRPDDTFPTVDVDVQDIEVIWPEWQIQPASLAAFRTIRRAALVAPKLMRRYRWHVGDEVALFGIQDLIPVTTQIVGVLDIRSSCLVQLNKTSRYPVRSVSRLGRNSGVF